MFLEEKVRKDSEPTFARIICAKLKCGGNAQIFAVALQQQEVLNPLNKKKMTDKDSEPTFARFICTKPILGDGAQIFAVALQQQEVLNPLNKKKMTDKDFVLVGHLWPARKDSNLRPSESESDALSSCATGRYCLIIILHGQKKVKLFLSH